MRRLGGDRSGRLGDQPGDFGGAGVTRWVSHARVREASGLRPGLCDLLVRWTRDG